MAIVTSPPLANAPLVDMSTGKVTPPWLHWFEGIVTDLQGGPIDVSITPVAQGGTGRSSWGVGDIVYASAVDALAGLADVARGAILVSGGIGAPPLWLVSSGNTGDVLTVLAGGEPAWQPTSTPSNHNLLSGIHADTTAGSPAVGDLIIGQGSPAKWARVALGPTGSILGNSGGSLGYFPIGANGNVLTSTGTTYAWTSPSHDLLSSRHPDTLAASPQRGDLLIGNSTPKWSRKGLGVVNSLLISDGADVQWTDAAVDTQTTVGSAGGASALPATPRGYLVLNLEGVERVVPFYDKT
jgi:hypothetical protein